MAIQVPGIPVSCAQLLIWRVFGKKLRSDGDVGDGGEVDGLHFMRCGARRERLVGMEVGSNLAVQHWRKVLETRAGSRGGRHWR